MKCAWVLSDGSYCREQCKYQVIDGKRKYLTYCSAHNERLKKQEALSLLVYSKTPLAHEYGADKFTCFGCSQVGTCQFAFDLYNLDGDCLAEK